MEGFTIVDAVVAGVIVLSAVLAWSRGIVRETLAIAGWVAAAVAGFVFAGSVEPLVRELPFVGDFLRSSCELSRIAAFATVVAAALVVMALITPALASFVQDSVLGGLDRALGLLFGAARGALLVAVALIVYERALPEGSIGPVESARATEIFAGLGTRIEAAVPEDALGWVVGRYEALVGHCAKPGEDA